MIKKFFWADEVVDHLLTKKKKEYVCEGMWTPSGHFHIGNFRPEVLIPNAVYRTLKQKGVKTRQNLVFDDFDQLRKIPKSLPIKEKDWEKEFGKALVFVPDPFNKKKSWAENFSSELKDGLSHYGLEINYISAYKSYKEGKYNDLIKTSLDNSKKIVEVWNRIAGSEKPDTFLPVQVVCESCKAFAEAVNWDGKKVDYKCKCGTEGTVSPFNGKAKLNWRVHWSASWIVNNVAFESAGKDHFSKGGSVEVSQAFMTEIFGMEKEFTYQIPTEFLQLKGAKMSGSIGNVITPGDWVDVASPELYRYLIFSYRPETTIHFSLDDNSYVLLNDRFDRAERVYFGEKAENEHIENKLKKAYVLAVLGSPEKKIPAQISFSSVVLLSQLTDPKNPKSALKMVEEAGFAKNLTAKDKKNLLEKLKRTKEWVEKYAPEEMKISFAETPPKVDVPDTAKSKLKELSSKLEKLNSPDDIQSAVFDIGKSDPDDVRGLFKVLYQILVGKERGPKIGNLIIALGKKKCINRIKEFS